MKILIVGSGAREHVLAWKISQSPRVQVVFVAPGNGGITLNKRLINIPITDINILADFVEKEYISLTIVGPESLLSIGIVDLFQARGLKIFGPTKEAAQLESSKSFAKAFMYRHNIPTAKYHTFSDITAAHHYISNNQVPIVIKADGLAAGKGVIVAMTAIEAHAAVEMMLSPDDKIKKISHASTTKIVIEEFLIGEEISFIVIVNGKSVLPLATSQDYKRLYDNNIGPNTGGMGACSPAQIAFPGLHMRIMNEIILPTIKGMIKDGIFFSGFLYAGLMIDKKGNLKTLEFNCRLGDPEAQVIMMRLKTDLVTLIEHAIAGTLNMIKLAWDYRTSLGVVIASAGYPKIFCSGDIITNIPIDTSTCMTFHAGTIIHDEKLIVSGGRVFCIVGLGDNIQIARKQAYAVAKLIHFNGAQMRRDIGLCMSKN